MNTTPKHILVAEDEAPQADAIVHRLSLAGYTAESVGNGADALAVLRAKHVDLLLLDLIMPVMNGFAVLETISKEHLPVPVIVLSTMNQTVEEQRARALGAKDFIAKSDVHLTQIVERVDAFFT